MKLELAILTELDEKPNHDLLLALLKATTGYSPVIIFGTRLESTGAVTKVRFGASNKREVLKALRTNGARFTRIRRLDNPLPPQRLRAVNEPPPADL